MGLELQQIFLIHSTLLSYPTPFFSFADIKSVFSSFSSAGSVCLCTVSKKNCNGIVHFLGFFLIAEVGKMEKPQQNFLVDNSVKLKKILLLSVFAFCAELFLENWENIEK